MGEHTQATNRLIHEKSPYLLQHAHNPVQWYPWGDEAFAKARAEDKPVFLSVGYSTCHWCHVMARESFADAEVAAALAAGFISVKVDREERPDIDAVYMAACQMLTGSGGWPLTVVMTPDQKPFWAGTYLPKTTAYGRLGLLELLRAIRAQWQSDRAKLVGASEQITELLRVQGADAQTQANPDTQLLHRAADALKDRYDVQWGGFSQAPKFPTPHNLLFLLRYSLLEQDDAVRGMAEHTLTQMYRGGIFDHIGGGFSRYATDRRWLIPHFEKMLYDNALLAYAYLEAFRLSGRELYRMVAQRTMDYVLAELEDPQGGFYCGQDADSDAEEGKYYLFTAQQIRRQLGDAQADTYMKWFGCTDKGNFEGKNILNLISNPQYEQPNPHMEAMSKTLYAYRLQRTALHKDDKVLTSWNALMIAALARAGWLLGAPPYLQAAQRAQRFIEQHLLDAQGGLMLRWREGEAAHPGQLDDYAFYAFALLELYQATFDVYYLRRALRIAEDMLNLFLDEQNGGLYMYSLRNEQLIDRPKEVYDGALPSGNSVAAVVLGNLFALTGDIRWREAADRQLGFVAGAAHAYPAGHCMAMLALTQRLYASSELVCATAQEDAPSELTAFLRQSTTPNLSVLLKTPGNQGELAVAAPFTAAYPVPDEGILYYLCRDGACAAPTRQIPGAP